MLHNEDQSPATPEGLIRWKNAYGINHVLMTGPVSVLNTLFQPPAEYLPSVKLLAPGMVVSIPGPGSESASLVQISDSQIESVLPK